MASRKLLLLLKPLDDYAVAAQSHGLSRIANPQILHHLESRSKVHREAVGFCQNVLRRKLVDWEPILRDNVSQPIRNVDMVVTVGGDGTLLHASHFVDDSIPLLGVNSDPTRVAVVEEFGNQYDATRSTGYLCAATVDNFEKNLFQILDDILEGQLLPSELSRISICVNSAPLSTCALNDVLIAHPCPAAVSRFSFRIKSNGQSCSPAVNYRSSGLRVSTAAGSTAAMLSAGGYQMPILSQDLQYMVREPISPRVASNLMHGFLNPDQKTEVAWFCKEGAIYIDGCNVCCTVKDEDTLEISSEAPVLKVYLPPRLLEKQVLPIRRTSDAETPKVSCM
ncbi:NADH kinase isoform X1 [Syzygium oleosum]|uniref:NADH kinase isoform X1 n=1 Tax=Syzygium oleosum TaxID=219896 RepID=UPI0024B92D6E|nr:NADH kinase isoform X1 [Syzygium oleosum]